MTTKTSTYFFGTDSRMVLRGLADRNNAPVVGATVTLESFVDRHGVPVAGLVFPVYFTDQGAGDYELALSSGLGMSPSRQYVASVRAMYLGLKAEWREVIDCQRNAS